MMAQQIYPPRGHRARESTTITRRLFKIRAREETSLMTTPALLLQTTEKLFHREALGTASGDRTRFNIPLRHSQRLQGRAALLMKRANHCQTTRIVNHKGARGIASVLRGQPGPSPAVLARRLVYPIGTPTVDRIKSALKPILTGCLTLSGTGEATLTLALSAQGGGARCLTTSLIGRLQIWARSRV